MQSGSPLDAVVAVAVLRACGSPAGFCATMEADLTFLADLSNGIAVPALATCFFHAAARESKTSPLAIQRNAF